MSEIKGDLKVCRTINVGRRANEGLLAKTITATEQLVVHSEAWQYLTAASSQDVVMPDATTLPIGWEIVVQAETSDLNVKTYDAVTPVLLEVVEAGRAYQFTLIDNGTDEGAWYVTFLSESDKIASTRYCDTFNATTDWGAAVGGFYTYTVLQSSHERGVNPMVQTFELSGSDYVKVENSEMKILANGNVEIKVPESPDCRYAGKMVLI